MDGFNSLIEDLWLGDLGFKGQMYTWANNKAGSDRIVERLDRALANDQWTSIYPRAQCIHGIAVGLDHAPIFIRLDYSDRRGRKNFKFEDMWLEKPDCLGVIKRDWSRGGTLFRPVEYNMKLKACRIDPMKWSRITFGNNRINIDKTKGRLEEISKSVPNTELLVEKVLKSKLHALWKNEEIY